MSASGSQPVSPQHIFEMAWGFATPLILEAALKNNVFDVLDAGPKTVEEIHAATGASVRGLRAIMNALCGLALLDKDATGRYKLTPESAAFLVSTKPGFAGGFVPHFSEQLLADWLHLAEIVRSGKPARHQSQQDRTTFFENLVPRLFGVNYPAAQALAQHLKLAEAKVLDIAAGSGVWGIALAESGAQVHITAVDWPDVLKITEETARKHDLADRFTGIAGDMYEVDFGKGYDVAIFGHVLHSEGVERNRALIKKTYAALASGGIIAIAEHLVDANHTGPLNALIFNVNMLVHTENGSTYSFEEISAWLRDAGCTDPRLLEAPGPSPLILATKP